jgi:predicted secreted protein
VAPTTAPASTLPSSTVTELTIIVGTDAEPSIKTATLRIVDEGGVVGSGFLADSAKASAAAAVFENPAAVKRLVEGAPPDQMCTEIYGGPDRATIEGTFRGASVSQQFHRSDGCGIADWELFAPILGRSHWDGEFRIYQADENEITVKAGATFTVELESNATTGYAWQPVVTPTGALVEGERQYLDPGTGTPGAGGWERFRFTAPSAGSATITFEYRRPWEPASTPPAATVTFTVAVSA